MRFSIIAGLIFCFSMSTAHADEAKLTWLGHAAFLLKTKSGKNVLIDPWLGNPKAPKDFSLKHVDLVLVTHGHSDHAEGSFDLAKKYDAPFVASYELTEIAKSNGVKNVSPLNPGGTATFDSVTVSAVTAVHSSSYGGEYAGAPLGFIISEKGSPTLYHSGDTGVFSDMKLIHDLYSPQVALLPIGGIYTMKPKEAAVATRLLSPKVVVPMHFGTFPALAGTPQELKTELKGSTKIKEMTPGVEVMLSDLIK